MSEATSFVEPETGARYSLSAPRWRGNDGRPLEVTTLPGITAADIDRPDRSIWRYRQALPLPEIAPVSLGEGCTPLIGRPFGGGTCHFKLEWFSPTGSFKDRGAAVLVSLLREQGVDAIVEDSSGNAGAAIAAYGAAAGISVEICVPAGTQPAKIVQIKAYGAVVTLVPGPREGAEATAIGQAGRFYASHNWHPFFLQGTKTLGYELWEDLGFVPPDNVIIPTGAGSNVLGCHLAFTELKRAGQISRLPRLFAAQPANCAPIHAHFQAPAGAPVEPVFAPTIAEGTAIKHPVRLVRVLDALRRSRGGTVAVSEDEIIAGTRALARLGLYVEPTSAGAAAAFAKLLHAGTIGRNEVTVAILTGGGLKASATLTQLFG